MGNQKKKVRDARFKSAIFDDYDSTIGEIFKADARTAAIMVGALVENYLEHVLQFHLPNKLKRGDEPDKLFDYPGILATFAAKIDLCYAMGIIGEVTYDNLRIIKDIRNEFAHTLLMYNDKNTPDHISFSTTTISKWCQSLKFDPYAECIRIPQNTEAQTYFTDLQGFVSLIRTNKDPRDRYTLISLWLVIEFHTHMRLDSRPSAPKPLLP